MDVPLFVKCECYRKMDNGILKMDFVLTFDSLPTNILMKPFKHAVILPLVMKLILLLTDGPINVNLSQPSWLDLERRAHDLEQGGHCEPTECVARHNVAIIVPYRDRETQLLLFLQHIHPYLKKQKISYTIYVIQQVKYAV